jgi:hypothetical protein
VAQVVRQARGLHHFGINAELLSKLRLFADAILREPTADLSNLDRMLLTSVEYVRFPCADNLSNSR